jgi:hypothetical protein
VCNLFIREKCRPDERLSGELEALDANARTMNCAERDSTCAPPDHQSYADRNDSETEEAPADATHPNRTQLLDNRRHCEENGTMK